VSGELAAEGSARYAPLEEDLRGFIERVASLELYGSTRISR
jgi:hypothetical protein